MSPTRLKFELIESQTAGAPAPAAAMPARPQRATPRLSQSANGHSSVLMELASGLDFLIAQLAKAEDSRTEMEAERDELRVNLDSVKAHLDEVSAAAREQQGVISEQQKALLLSMELMRRLEEEVSTLRAKVETIEQNATPAATPSARVSELEAAVAERDGRIESLERSIAGLEAKLAAKDAQLTQLRDDFEKVKAEHASLPSLAEIRSLESQRDQARAEAATARADLSIQSAELESKEELISALERALEQQHGSLRSLEERLAAYAARLQELRMERLTMPGADPSSALEEERGSILAAFKGLFSPASRLRKEHAE